MKAEDNAIATIGGTVTTSDDDNKVKADDGGIAAVGAVTATNTGNSNDDGNQVVGGGAINDNDVIATQTLKAVITNDGGAGERGEGAYNSGDNTIRGNAFAAFAGILTQAWNTGVNANIQTGTNIAATGAVTFTGDNAP